MAYLSGNTILDDEYNSFATDLNTIWGTASGNNGYGQGSAISTVSPGSTITATQWETMLSRLETIATHQNTPGVSFATVSAGQNITALTDLTGDVESVQINRGNCLAQGSDITANSNNTTGWYTHTTFTANTAFADANSAKEFFNGGGMIGVNFTNQGGATTDASGIADKDTAWGNIISAFGTVWLTSAGSLGPATAVTLAGTSYNGVDKKGGSGSVTTESNTGFFNLTGSWQELFKQYDATYVYTSNYITCRYYTNGSTVYIEVKLFDNANTSAAPGATQDEIVDLNIQCNLTVRQPSTTYLSNSWGTPSASVTHSSA